MGGVERREGGWEGWREGREGGRDGEKGGRMGGMEVKGGWVEMKEGRVGGRVGGDNMVEHTQDQRSKNLTSILLSDSLAKGREEHNRKGSCIFPSVD